MEKPTKCDRFKSILKTIFQYQEDRLSLDFGVYRIFRHKAGQIEQFLEQDLPRLVDEAAARHGVTADDAYNDILSFFSRYYQDGDFFPVPQFGGDGTYTLRHNGEETFFAWANQDQYYIKSLANVSRYCARDILPEDMLRSKQNTLVFMLGETGELKGDQKKTRYFILVPDKTVVSGGDVTLVFDYKPDKASAVTPESLHEHLRQKGADIPLQTLAHHFNRFTNQRRVDFFIHRRLDEYLREQLDAYVKQKLVKLDEPYTLKRAAVAKETGEVVIAFLDKLEKLQQRLWEKKKFAYGVGYLITLDRIAKHAGAKWLESRLGDILKSHREEWRSLGLGDHAKPKDVRKGESFLPLPVDTRKLAESFKWDLLEAVTAADPLDGLLDGVAVHSDNWQALNTFRARLQDRIKCFYIDPPYNTGTDGFPYKDGYPHSTWLSMIEDRLRAAKPLLKNNGAIFVSIDAKEQRHLQIAMDNVFGSSNRVEEIIWVQNTTKNQSPTYSTNHEYVEVYANSLGAVSKDERMFREPKPGREELMELADKLNPQYLPTADIEQEIKRFFEKHRAELTAELEAQGLEYEKSIDPWKGLYNYQYVEYRDDEDRLVPEKNAKAKKAVLRIWMSDNPSFPLGGGTAGKEGVYDPKHPDYRFYKPKHDKTGKPCPHPKSGWRFPFKPVPGLKTSFTELADNDKIDWGETEKSVPRVKKYLHDVDTQVSKSVVTEYTDGEKELSDLTGKTRSFPNPKPTPLIGRFILQTTDADEWVGDFTVGSGTTAHAIAETFHADRKRRRFFLVELGDHYETTFLPRLKRVFSAKRWKAGKPAALDGHGLFCKVLRLEQYEETLENSTLRPEAVIDVAKRLKSVGTLAPFPELYRDQFLAVLPHFVETASPALLMNLDNDWLTNPFDYRLQILEDGLWVEQAMDLPETLSLLLGMEVERVKRLEYKGRPRLIIEGAGIVCYWREFEPNEINEAYVRGDMALLAKHAPPEDRALYINGIAQRHAKGWLPANAKETLYTMRTLMMAGASS